MIRKIIHIDEELCDGCGICIDACAEGALQLINGKAKLIRDDYCDGLGACLKPCPTGALKLIERAALPFDEEAVEANIKLFNQKSANANSGTNHGGCPSMSLKMLKGQGDNLKSKGIILENSVTSCPSQEVKNIESKNSGLANFEIGSELRQFPIQLQLVPISAPFFDNADLLIAADCTAFAYGDFHRKFLKGKICLIGCPKLDDANYAEKIASILINNDIKSVMLLKMEVPCCGGLYNALVSAIKMSGKVLPFRSITVSRDGKIYE